MKHDLQLDRSRLLGFKLTAKSGIARSHQPCDPRIGAKIGKGLTIRINGSGKADQRAS
jgi:hypothetical protein